VIWANAPYRRLGALASGRGHSSELTSPWEVRGCGINDSFVRRSKERREESARKMGSCVVFRERRFWVQFKN
jgi:hypothetical protein